MSGAQTLGRWVSDRARSTPGRVAIECGTLRWTYAELEHETTRLAAGLRARGLRPGDRVGTLTYNSAEHVAVLFACARLGLILQPLSWRLTAPELAYQLADGEPSLVLATAELTELARAAAGSLPVVALELEQLAADGEPGEAVLDDDALLLVYTGGTTGRSKGAVLTHANCFWTNLSLDGHVGLGSDDVVLQMLPQFHVGGWNVLPLLAVWKGARLVIQPTFDPAQALALIEQKHVTATMGVPANYQFMADAPGFETSDVSTLRRAIVGGAPMPTTLIERWGARGVGIAQGYGLTEAAPNVLCLAPEDALRKAGCAGMPYPHVDVALRDAATERFVGGVGTGELVVRGPNVFAGYWRAPGATAEVLADGWLLTGDIAERDPDGCYRIVGRSKEMLVSGGENVYPVEIEDVLHAHPAVAEAAVVGVPDERWGEAAVAFVALRAGVSVTEEELVEHCRARLATFKVPRSVRLVGALPRSALGKVRKDELRLLATERQEVGS
jgi:fatty-acyl-CoA synthase